MPDARDIETVADVVELLGREAEHVKQETAEFDPAAALADLKRRPKAPKPFVGYVVANADWAPPPKTRQSWVYSLPQMFVGLKDAQAARDGFRAMAPECPDKVILEATITFRVVEGGGNG